MLARLITAPNGVAEGLASERELPRGGLDAVVVGDDRLSADDRVGIYANMYFYRLLDVLGEDFPATAAVLGEINFHNLITGYLLEYPPSEPSVMHCGRYLPDYLRGHPLSRQKTWLADLAMLERAIIDVFCAADATPLETSTMNAIAPEKWASVRMRTLPAAKILEFDWDVASVLRAIESKRKWRAPAHRKTAILVWRKSDQVSYRKLDALERHALKAASADVNFGEICDVIANQTGPTRAPNKIASLLRQWLDDGVMTVISRRSSPARRSSRISRRV